MMLASLFSYPFNMNGKKHNFFGGQHPLILLLQMRRHRLRMLTRTVVEDDDVSLHSAVKDNYAKAWKCAETVVSGDLASLFSYPFNMNGKKHNFFGGQHPLILLLH
jgi:hypothetical protein